MAGYSRKVRVVEGRDFEISECQSGYYVRVDGVDMRHFSNWFAAWRFQRRLIRHQAEANSLANPKETQGESK